MRVFTLGLVLAACVLLVAACGDDDSSKANTPNGAGPVGHSTAAVTPPSQPSETAVKASPSTAASATTSRSATASLTITSTAFADGANIPVEFSCDGKSSSPALSWSGAPAGTKEFAMTMFDPDAGTSGFVHWVVYAIPASATSLAAAASPGGSLPPGTREGANGRGASSYTGPCPPKGGAAHHYVFTLSALDTTLTLDAGKSKADLDGAIKGHILAQSTLTGLFTH